MFEELREKARGTKLVIDWNGIRFASIAFVIGLIMGVLI